MNVTEKLPASLADDFVPFSFQYPSSFVAQAQAEEIFVTVEKLGGSDGKTPTQSFSVGWYGPPEPETPQTVNKILTDQFQKWVQFLPGFRCKEVSRPAETVGGVKGSSLLVEFVTEQGAFTAAGKTILLRAPGQKKGIAVSLYGTWEDPAIKSAADLGRNDDLAKILRTFRFSGTDGAAPKEVASEQQAMINAAAAWLRSLDAGKYQENFAATSEAFRKDLTASAWAKNHASMQKEFGAVVSRSDDVKLTTRTSLEAGKETVTHIVKTQTKFQKMAATEAVTMVKETGTWKVADYSVTTGNVP